VDGQKGVHEGGPPYPCSVVSGREVCRNTLGRKHYIFGSPSTRLIRADLVRKHEAYYNESYYHAGPAECFEQLQNCDFGFVHQVLSYTRRDIDAQTATFRQRYATERPERLAWLKEYGPAYFDRDELGKLFRNEEQQYYRFLAQQVLSRRGKDFFDYHEKRLEQHGFHLSRKRLAHSLIRELTGLIAHPHSIKLLIKRSRKHTGSKG
jgi:hypothetical protein